MAVRGHDDEVWLGLLGQGDDGAAGVLFVNDANLGADAEVFEVFREAAEVNGALLDFSSLTELTVNTACDALFDMKQDELGAVLASEGAGMRESDRVAVGVVEGEKDRAIDGRADDRKVGGGHGVELLDSFWLGQPGRGGDPSEEDEKGPGEQKSPGPEGFQCLPGEAEVQHDDDGGRGPGQTLDPEGIGERAHFLWVGSEVNQRDDGEGQLETEQNLAKNEKLISGCFSGNQDGDDRGGDRKQTGEKAPEPGFDAEIDEAFHDDLAGHRAGDC